MCGGTAHAGTGGAGRHLRQCGAARRIAARRIAAYRGAAPQTFGISALSSAKEDRSGTVQPSRSYSPMQASTKAW
ncbi:hypothetical protein GCM10009839_71740 [Catenulispora yoronensis]|uniref:Uncharacterized protein n=1 Tax=Catenulispora yoronensis TaxID=450799 RepID=A0ABP5GX75_9ACTN